MSADNTSPDRARPENVTPTALGLQDLVSMNYQPLTPKGKQKPVGHLPPPTPNRKRRIRRIDRTVLKTRRSVSPVSHDLLKLMRVSGNRVVRVNLDRDVWSKKTEANDKTK